MSKDRMPAVTPKPNPGKAVARLLARRQAERERTELKSAKWKFNPFNRLWIKRLKKGLFLIENDRAQALAHCRRSKG